MKKTKKTSKKKENKKTKKPKEKEEAKLEEEIKTAEEEIKEETEEQTFSEPIRQLPISNETSAPVLERIIQRQEQTQAPTQTNFNTEERENRETRIDYSPASNAPNYGFQRNTSDESEDRKYETIEMRAPPPVLQRREAFRDETRQEFMKPTANPWQEQAQRQMREDREASDIELINQELRLPFEEQKKYKGKKLR